MGWRAEDIPDQSGRVAVITGANSGIGLEAGRALSASGAQVVMAVRDVAKGERAAAELAAGNGGPAAEVRELDLADLRSIRAFAEAWRADGPDRLDLLINNAGVMATPLRRTADGFELQFGTNHLGHFALTGLLLPELLAQPGSRVVTVSSHAHRMGDIDFDDLNWHSGYSRWRAYGRSKLANLLFAFELQRRLERAGAATSSLAAHPGYTATNLQSAGPSLGGGIIAAINTAGARFGNLVIGQSAAMGALPLLYAGTAPDLPGASYIGPDGPLEARGLPKPVTPRRLARNESVAARLWEASTELTGVDYAAIGRGAGAEGRM